MTPAYQAVQAGHSSIQFQHEHPDIAKNWHNNSKYLIYLSVENEQSLIKLISKLEKFKIKFSVFREPDIDNQITSICIEPSDKTRRITSSLPKMLKDISTENKIDKNNYKPKI